MGLPFKAKLTRDLAIELLIRAADCRPVNPTYAMAFAFEFLGGTYQVDNGDPIGIVNDTDSLYSGVQRLAGMILSGLKQQEMLFQFIESNAIGRVAYIELLPYPNRYLK